MIKAYPDIIDGYSDNEVILKNGTKIIWNDGKNKSHDEKLENADLEDQMSQIYCKGECSKPNVDYEPGRIRNEKFFLELYGKSEQAVRKNLVPIEWLPKNINQEIQVTKINNVHKKLEAVSKELDLLVNKDPSMKKFLVDLGGTFNWRKIAGTERLSNHSFGTAIDISVAHSNYWRWSANKIKSTIQYQNKIPQEIVEIFERHGFIWGGKWYHFDTMHFEYRPELLLCAQ